MPDCSDDLGRHLRDLYDEATFGGDATAVERGLIEVKAAEAQLALARGRFLHARFLRDRQDRPEQLEQLARAAELFAELGDVSGQADATFWTAVYHQVVRDDEAAAVPLLRRARELAQSVDGSLVLSYVVRHLGFVEQHAGRVDQARQLFEESVQLRRRIGFRPGIAAGLLALAELAATAGDTTAAQRQLDEAVALCDDTNSYGVTQWAEQTRRRHGLT